MAQEKYTINWDYKEFSFKDFVSTAEKHLMVKFFYDDEWVKDLKLGDYAGNNTLPDILNNLFREKSLYYFIDEAGNVILTKKTITSFRPLTMATTEKTVRQQEMYLLRSEILRREISQELLLFQGIFQTGILKSL
jgi:hypothetical protein